MTSVVQQRAASLANAFGFDPLETQHHFLVSIPRGAAGKIEISEHFSWDEMRGSSEISYNARPDGQIRVMLPRPKWDVIADPVRAEFNIRLRHMSLKLGGWKSGANLLRRELGKELVLLAWAIEDADPALVPHALANWGGLAPEERWWLYTQTAGATGHGINHRGVGWRRAVRYALTENPVSTFAGDSGPIPAYFHAANAAPLFADESANNSYSGQPNDPAEYTPNSEEV